MCLNGHIQGNKIFSFILENRSIDFICQSEEEILTFVEGGTYIINKYWQQQKLKNIKIFFPKGKILWK